MQGGTVLNSDTRRSLERLVSAIGADPAVRAVGRSGGDRPLPKPGEGDIDLFVYCTEIPLPGNRKARLDTLGDVVGQVQIGALTGGAWGVADALYLGGVETWVMYFTVDQLWAEIAAVLRGESVKRVDEDYYPVGRLAMLQSIESLYDPDGLFTRVSDAIAAYPAELMRAVLDYHLPRMDDREDFERAVRRQDVLFYHFVLDLAIDHFLQSLFALNKTYFPSRKRSIEYIARFATKPARCEERLLAVVELGARPESLAESYRTWQELTRELADLAH